MKIILPVLLSVVTILSLLGCTPAQSTESITIPKTYTSTSAINGSTTKVTTTSKVVSTIDFNNPSDTFDKLEIKPGQWGYFNDLFITDYNEGTSVNNFTPSYQPIYLLNRVDKTQNKGMLTTDANETEATIALREHVHEGTGDNISLSAYTGGYIPVGMKISSTEKDGWITVVYSIAVEVKTTPIQLEYVPSDITTIKVSSDFEGDDLTVRSYDYRKESNKLSVSGFNIVHDTEAEKSSGGLKIYKKHTITITYLPEKPSITGFNPATNEITVVGLTPGASRILAIEYTPDTKFSIKLVSNSTPEAGYVKAPEGYENWFQVVDTIIAEPGTITPIKITLKVPEFKPLEVVTVNEATITRQPQPMVLPGKWQCWLQISIVSGKNVSGVKTETAIMASILIDMA